MALPGLVSAANREGHGAHQARPALQPGKSAVANGEVKGFGADVDAAIDVEPASAAAEIGIGSQKVGQAREALGRSHSCRMYSIIDPSKAGNAAFANSRIARTAAIDKIVFIKNFALCELRACGDLAGQRMSCVVKSYLGWAGHWVELGQRAPHSMSRPCRGGESWPRGVEGRSYALGCALRALSAWHPLRSHCRARRSRKSSSRK